MSHWEQLWKKCISFLKFRVAYAYMVYRELRNTFTAESVVDLGFPPESLTPKPELFPLCQADSGYGVIKKAWAALRIRVSRETRPEFYHPGFRPGHHRGHQRRNAKGDKPQCDVLMEINLNGPSFYSPFKEEPQVMWSSFSSFQNTRNVLKYDSISSSDHLNCTAVRQTHFQASSHLI